MVFRIDNGKGTFEWVRREKVKDRKNKQISKQFYLNLSYVYLVRIISLENSEIKGLPSQQMEVITFF